MPPRTLTITPPALKVRSLAWSKMAANLFRRPHPLTWVCIGDLPSRSLFLNFLGVDYLSLHFLDIPLSGKIISRCFEHLHFAVGIFGYMPDENVYRRSLQSALVTEHTHRILLRHVEACSLNRTSIIGRTWNFHGIFRLWKVWRIFLPLIVNCGRLVPIVVMRKLHSAQSAAICECLMLSFASSCTLVWLAGLNTVKCDSVRFDGAPQPFTGFWWQSLKYVLLKNSVKTGHRKK